MFAKKKNIYPITLEKLCRLRIIAHALPKNRLNCQSAIGSVYETITSGGVQGYPPSVYPAGWSTQLAVVLF